MTLGKVIGTIVATQKNEHLKGKKIAIIGAGPAGLATGHSPAKQGSCCPLGIVASRVTNFAVTPLSVTWMVSA